MQKTKTHDVELYLGSINEKTKEEFSYEDLIREISLFQDDQLLKIPVCVTDVEFVSGSDYREKGWKVSVINYPRIRVDTEDINRFMINLAMALAFIFKQNRVTVIGPEETVMIEG